MTNKRENRGLITSGRDYRDLPDFGVPEFGILGRSNVGKSSFINFVTGKKGLAPVSESPGKTRRLNCYRVEGCVWTDLPGYGYAKTSKRLRGMLSRQIQEYIMYRETLTGLIWLLDIRHPGNKNDLKAYEWLGCLELPLLPVFTKCDKLKKGEISRNLDKYLKFFNQNPMYSLVSVRIPERKRDFYRTFKMWKEMVLSSPETKAYGTE